MYSGFGEPPTIPAIVAYPFSLGIFRLCACPRQQGQHIGIPGRQVSPVLSILRRMSPEALSELISSIAHNLVAAGRAGALTDELIPPVDKLAVMRPKDRAHGDWASNIAMPAGKKAGMKPRDLAEPFAARSLKPTALPRSRWQAPASQHHA